jgi:hypothetical protein
LLGALRPVYERERLPRVCDELGSWFGGRRGHHRSGRHQKNHQSDCMALNVGEFAQKCWRKQEKIDELA